MPENTSRKYDGIDNIGSKCCKDCANFYNNHLCRHWSKYGTIEVRSNDYCSYFVSIKKEETPCGLK